MTASGFDTSVLGDVRNVAPLLYHFHDAQLLTYLHDKTPDFGWLEHELNFLKQDSRETFVESPKNTEHSGGSPRSTTGTVETDPILTTPGSEFEGPSFPFRRDSLASDEKPSDDVFIKPPIPDRLKSKQQQPFTKSPLHDDMNVLSSTFQSKYKYAVLDGQRCKKRQRLCFAASNGYSVESPAGVLESTYGLVLGPFFHQLLRLYFQNIHPYYPVIDEFDFDACFAEPIEDGNLRNSRACVLGVVLLCASMVCHTLSVVGVKHANLHPVPQLQTAVWLLSLDATLITAIHIPGCKGLYH
jgi:hypothetical protein